MLIFKYYSLIEKKHGYDVKLILQLLLFFISYINFIRYFHNFCQII